MWFQKNKGKLIAAAAVIIVLTIAFFAGGDLPSKDSEPVPQPPLVQAEKMPEGSAALSESKEGADTPQLPLDQPALEAPKEEELPSVAPEAPAEGSLNQETGSMEEKSEAPASEEKTTEKPAEEKQGDAESPDQPQAPSPRDPYQTDPIPEGKPAPVEPQDAVKTDERLTCTISISCASLLSNMELLDPEKKELVPANGWILEPLQVEFNEGESVFHVLLRTCKKQGIHLEFENTPIYNSAYIEGIHNLYEFDAGDLSGWMYKVNGWFPNYGCSRYQLSDGDEICWVYTCDLGNDVGGGYSTAN